MILLLVKRHVECSITRSGGKCRSAAAKRRMIIHLVSLFRVLREVPKVRQPDKIRGKANINQGKETSVSAPPETLTSFHLTLKLATSF